MSEAELLIHDSPEALAADVAERLLTRLHEIQVARRTPQVALTGGTIADVVHATIARLAGASEVDWGNVAFWWGDERFVAPDSPDRNVHQARHALLDTLVPLGLDEAKVHEMPSTATAATVDEGAAAYAEVVRAEGGGEYGGEFDVLMLGMGPDGHIASLFPGFPQVAVDDAIAVGVTGSPKPPPERISLTLPALNRSREVWFLVSGAEKSAAVQAALRGGSAPPTPAEIAEIPARGVTGDHATRWFLDRAAASALD